jgi:hypothetical protein
MKSSRLKKLDLFKKNVSLTYEGREDFSTWLGFTVTIVFVITILSKGLSDL